MLRSAKVIAFSVTSLAPFRALSAWPSKALIAWCAAEMKPSKACLACSTLLSANVIAVAFRPSAPGTRRRRRRACGRTLTGNEINPMRIVDIRECAVPLKSDISNSSFDFSERTTSVVAVITDVVREGRPVVGFAFNSTGRYACGAAMRARFVPRILGADPRSLLDETQENFDPEKILAVMMQREKSGGHSERSIAIGTVEVAIWDAVAKIAGKPLHAVLAERFHGGRLAKKVFCYVRGGWYWPGQTIKDLQEEMRRHLDAGYTMVKMKVGGLPLDQDLRRPEAVLHVVR